MAYAQLTRRDGLRDLEAVLNTKRQHFYHLGVRRHLSRSTMARRSRATRLAILLSTRSASNCRQTGTGVQSDQSIRFTTKKAGKDYPQQLRRVAFFDEKIFLTNRYELPALTIAQIYKERWKSELFFKWLKQNLTVKHFLGNSENAVKAQIWIAVCVYLMVLIACKTLKLDMTMQLLLHALEANLFDKMTLQDLVKSATSTEPDPTLDSQLDLLWVFIGQQ